MSTPDKSGKEKEERSPGPPRAVLRTVFVAVGIAGIALIALYLLRSFATVLLLVFASVLFGIFLDGVATLLAEWLRLPRRVALALVVMLLLGLCAGFVWLAGPQVAHQVQQLGEQLPKSVALLQARLQQSDWGQSLLSSLPSLGDIQLPFASILGPVSQAFSMTLELVGSLVLIFFVGLYFAAAPEFYVNNALLLFSREHRTRGREVVAALGTGLRWWLLGRVLTMALMGILTTLALWLLKVPLALVLGIIAGLLLFVPYLGAVAAAIPAMSVGLVRAPRKPSGWR